MRVSSLIELNLSNFEGKFLFIVTSDGKGTKGYDGNV